MNFTDEPKERKTGITSSGVAYEIVEQIGVLGTNRNGISLELNRISFNGKKPMLDIRRWSYDEEGNRIMRTGISLKDADVEALKKFFMGNPDE